MIEERKVLKCGTKFKVAIKDLDGYSLEGVENGDIGEITGNYLTSNASLSEYWSDITLFDGTVVEDFMIDVEDIEVIND